MTNGG